MKSVRLLPVVIFAALALLLFKGIGLVTNGGYILTGPTAVQAAGDTGHGEAAPAEGAAPADVELADSRLGKEALADRGVPFGLPHDP